MVYYYRLGSQENCAQKCGFDSHRHSHFSALCITQTKKCYSNSIVALHDISCEFRHSDRGCDEVRTESSCLLWRLKDFFAGYAGESGLKWFTSTDWVPKKTAHREKWARFPPPQPFFSVMHYPHEKGLQQFNRGVA